MCGDGVGRGGGGGGRGGGGCWVRLEGSDGGEGTTRRGGGEGRVRGRGGRCGGGGVGGGRGHGQEREQRDSGRGQGVGGEEKGKWGRQEHAGERGVWREKRGGGGGEEEGGGGGGREGGRGGGRGRGEGRGEKDRTPDKHRREAASSPLTIRPHPTPVPIVTSANMIGPARRRTIVRRWLRLKCHGPAVHIAPGNHIGLCVEHVPESAIGRVSAHLGVDHHCDPEAHTLPSFWSPRRQGRWSFLARRSDCMCASLPRSLVGKPIGSCLRQCVLPMCVTSIDNAAASPGAGLAVQPRPVDRSGEAAVSGSPIPYVAHDRIPCWRRRRG